MADKTLETYFKDFSSKKILVVGDVMLDVFIRGEVDRISPEAPVPVVFETSRTAHLGGAGNTANNVAALGAGTMLLGVVGSDAEGRKIAELARGRKIKPYFAVDVKRGTTIKTRVAARRHQLVRIDQETKAGLNPAIERKLISLIAKLPVPDWIIVSDYAKGVITKEVMAALKKRFGARKIIADFRPENAPLFKHVYAITPNINEAAIISRIHATTDAKAVETVRVLAKQLDVSVILTRGEQGMTVYEAGGGKPVHIPSEAREVFDVTGAGDTVIAVVALMLAAGAKLHVAARAANHAAGLVVEAEGTAAVRQEELLQRIRK